MTEELRKVRIVFHYENGHYQEGFYVCSEEEQQAPGFIDSVKALGERVYNGITSVPCVYAWVKYTPPQMPEETAEEYEVKCSEDGNECEFKWSQDNE